MRNKRTFPKRLKLCGRSVRVSRMRLRKVYGDQEPGLIRLDSRLTGRKLLAALLHECIHEIDPDLSERRVEKLDSNLSRALSQAGYHRD